MAVFAAFYFLVCLFFYQFQEQFIFNPKKLDANHKFDFGVEYDEVYLDSYDGTKIHGVLFKSESSLGLIFFLHGSGGNVSWYKESIPVYTGLNYDIFILDYRGYGKSDGKIKREEDIFLDAKSAYEYVKKLYSEDQIIIIGFSMGGPVATRLASEYSPKALILEGTIFDMIEKGKKKFPFLPVSIIERYGFRIKNYIPKVDAPIIIFHGDQDKASDVNNSLRLRPMLKVNDRIIIFEGEGHHDFAGNDQYIEELRKIID